MIDSTIWLPDVLPQAVCDAYLNSIDKEGWQDATIGVAGGGLGMDASIRRSKVQWLPEDHFLSSVLRGAMETINQKHFRFDIRTFELAQLTRYQPGDRYSWHCDEFYPHPGQEDWPLADRTVRKLSICLQLTPPSKYTGGDLQTLGSHGVVSSGKERGECWRQQGSALVFLSTMQHQVSTVIIGTRISVVMWASGPLWR